LLLLALLLLFLLLHFIFNADGKADTKKDWGRREKERVVEGQRRTLKADKSLACYFCRLVLVVIMNLTGIPGMPPAEVAPPAPAD